MSGPLLKKFINVWGDLKSGKLVVGATTSAQSKTANATLNAQDSGKITYVEADGIVITLPTANANTAGLSIHIVNAQENGNGNVTITPSTGTMIMGNGMTAANNNSLKLTKATAKKGDMVSLVGCGAVGWYINEIVGTWVNT